MTFASTETLYGLDRETLTASEVPLKPARKLHGLRLPVIPTGAWLAQVGGAVATLSGVFMLAGAAVALIVGGVASVTLGALREAGKV